MRRTELGSTGMELSRIGFGAWAVGGGGYQFGWGDQSDRDSIAAIHRGARARGELDRHRGRLRTRPLRGVSLPLALQGIEPRPYVFTKASRVVDANGKIGRQPPAEPRSGGSWKRASSGSPSTRSTCTRFTGPIPDEDIEEGWTTLADLKEEGHRPAHRRVEFQRWSSSSASRGLPPSRTLQPPYSLLAARDRGRDAPLLPGSIGSVSSPTHQWPRGC